MIGIIGAMTEEVEIIESKMTDVKEKIYSNTKFYEGKIGDKSVVLMQSGIGKVNASMSTTVLFEHYDIDLIINIGTAGGLKEDCEVLDIVLSNKLSYHDVDVTAFNYAYGQVPKLPLYFESSENLLNLSEQILQVEGFRYHKGLIVSGDAFIHETSQREHIQKHFNEAIAVEMEAAAIAHVCHLYEKPFVILRSLSDIAGRASNISFEEYLQKASLNSSNVVLKLVEML